MGVGDAPEFISGNIFIRRHAMEKGVKIDGHQHNFDHTSIVFTGSVHIRARYAYRRFLCPSCSKDWETRKRDVDECIHCGNTKGLERISERDELLAERDFTAPAHVLIKADVEHEITALEEGTQFWCVYSHRDAQGRITQEWDGWNPAYL